MRDPTVMERFHMRGWRRFGAGFRDHGTPLPDRLAGDLQIMPFPRACVM